MTTKIETCTRCGHQSNGCQHCGREDPFLGAEIGGKPYCHTFSETTPTCYTVACWETPVREAAAGAKEEFIVRPPKRSGGLEVEQ